MRRFLLFITLAPLIVLASPAQGEFRWASLGGVELWTIPQPDPAAGLKSTILELRTTDPEGSLVTFTNLRIVGSVHQAWLDGPFGQPTPSQDKVLTDTFHADWRPFDSHLLITPDMVGGGFGGDFEGISETNDGSSRFGAELSALNGFGPVTGIGEIAMEAPTDAFFLKPQFQSNRLPLARLVVSCEANEDVALTLGVLGSGIVNAGVDGGAAFGYLGNSSGPLVFCLPEPSNLWTGMVLFLGFAAGFRRRNARKHRRGTLALRFFQHRPKSRGTF